MIDQQTVRAVTHEVCHTTLQINVADCPDEVGLNTDALLAAVNVAGGWNAKITVLAQKSLAREIAGRMFACEPENLDGSEIDDSLGELANIIGGNLKGIVGEEATLAIPTVESCNADASQPAGMATCYEYNNARFAVFVESD